MTNKAHHAKIAAAVVAVATAVAANAETYHIKRGGMENARFDLKADKAGYQWLQFAACNDSWWKKGTLSDYPAQIEAELKSLYGGRPRCNKTGYPADLWWAQYIPGGRVSSTHTVCWDSNILKDAAMKDAAAAALQFEVIVRQAMAFNPRQSWLVVHGDDPEIVADYKEGRVPQTVLIAEKVAAHYDLPTLNLAKAAADGGADTVSAAVTAFVNDVLNPSGIPAKAVPRTPPAPLAEGLNAQCHVVAYDDGSVRKLGDWKQGVASPNANYMSAMRPGGAGDRLEMEFRGTEAGLVDFSVQNGAEYAFRVDGGVWKPIPPSDGTKLAERHLLLASGLARSNAVSADSDAVRHTVEVKVVKPGEGCVIGFALNGSTADEDAGAGKGIGKIADIDRQYAALKPLKFRPPKGRHALIPNTMKRLQAGPSLRIVCLGDSIVSDTCKSKFELLLERMYPKCKVTNVCSVRSATGCWWYKDENRIDGWVFSHKPDLLVIGGVSQRDDVESVRSVIRQCRAKDPSLEILVMSPVFGREGSTDEHAWNVGWNYDPDKAQHPFRRQLRDVCAEEKVAFFDINAPWRQYILDSGMDVGYYHRDNVHSNVRGQVIIGKLIEKWFEAEHGATADSGTVGTPAPKPTFAVRFDDNRCPSWWRDIAAVFERHGFRCTFAVNAATLNEKQGACLRELAARGHEIADHTPAHSIHLAVYPDQASFERARRLPFAHDADPQTRRVYFDWEADDAHPSNVTFRASVVDGALVPSGAYAGKKPPTRFFKLPGRDGVFGYKEEAGRLMLRDFWERAPAETLQMEDGDVLGYSGWALQPCDGLLRELAALTRERFDHFGIPRPAMWIFPGGWCGPLRQDAMERVLGRCFGYIGAEAKLGPVKRGGGRWYAAYSDAEFFDGNSPADPDTLAAKIAAKLESGKSHITLSHMQTKDFAGFLERTERFLQRLEERGVNVVTVGESVEARFSRETGKGAKKPFPVVLTFDDGTKEHWTIAAPMLAEFGYPATFNPVTRSIGKRPNGLSWDEVRGLVRMGFDIATHTRSHTPLTKLLQEGKTEQLRSEVVDSATEIERETGYHVTHVCLPGNYWSPEIDREVKALGFGVQEWRRPGIGGGEGVTKTPREQAKAAIEKAMADGRGQCALMFHGIDKMGWRPLPRGAEDLRDVFELLREMERAGTIRVVSCISSIRAWTRATTTGTTSTPTCADR